MGPSFTPVTALNTPTRSGPAENNLEGKPLIGLKEAQCDLAEINYLIAGLDEDKSEELSLVRTTYFRCLDLLERGSRWMKGEQLDQLLESIRDQFLCMKNSLRVHYRQRGLTLCISDWQSPIYSSTLTRDSNRLDHGIKEHSWDYKRDGHLDALPYEEGFLQQYANHLGSSKLRAYLTNSGMAAFTTVSFWLAHELRLSGPVLAIQPMYFENIHLLKGIFPDLHSIDNSTGLDIGTVLQELNPSLVFCDAVTNCGMVINQQVEQIISWAANNRDKQKPVAIVIDTTCLPVPFIEKDLFKDLPEQVSIFIVESLAKYHQFGMDTVTAGIVLAHLSDNLHNDFKKTRARLGTNITDSSVGALPQPSLPIFTRRMERHSANTALLIDLLQSSLDVEGSILKEISWLEESSAACPWFHGTCFTLWLKDSFRSVKHYQEFENEVISLAHKVGHPLALSTSFGFDVSRLYVTAPSTKFEEPFLRISVGTETSHQIRAFASIIIEASANLANRSQALQQLKPSGKISNKALAPEQISQPTLPFERRPIRGSVFSGKEALSQYLNPANFAPTPLVELPADLNPFLEDGVSIYAKMMPLVPLMNIKSVPAFSMLDKAAKRGDLVDVEGIIESSSSNTVLSLSVIAKLFGIHKTCALVDHSIAPNLLKMLRLFGVEPYLHPGPGHEEFNNFEPRSDRASAWGTKPGWFNPGQYSNADNPEGFAAWLAPDLYVQSKGKIDILACGLGTCGTAYGLAKSLKTKKAAIKVLGCCPQEGHNVPGPRIMSQLGDVSFDWQPMLEERLSLTETESFQASVQLLRRGIMGGPSSGMNYAGLINFLGAKKADGSLSQYQDSEGRIFCVFVCCDSPLPHVDDYYRVLPEDFFPPVHPVPER